MLILNRRPGEAILLDGGIRVVVLGSDRRGARIGIEAPPETAIRREELVSDVAAENRRAKATESGKPWLGALPLRTQSAPAGSPAVPVDPTGPPAP
ncbi:MAG TPA: carbon storage regulator [Gemmatimonadales bacterium]|nr:carbon storage regulator [Gemmatimonadales bacterium]